MYLEGQQAEGLLAAWSAPWHPALIAAAGNTPVWHRADEPPQQTAGSLILVPEVSQSLLLAGWEARAENEGAVVLRGEPRREVLVRTALERCVPEMKIDADLAADFLALGFMFLQTELLTRQMRYMSNIDEVHFQSETVLAAKAASAGDHETSRSHLTNCFEVLVEARERFYPADAYLLDLTLVAPTTIGPALRRELESPTPKNLLISGEVLEHLAEKDPESVASIRRRLDEGTLSIIGGEATEQELPLAPLESLLDQFRAGAAIYQRYLSHRPRIFGRRRFGLSPTLPQVLSRLGYRGAIHVTLDEGRFPRGEQSKIQWEGLDGSVIDALSRVPLEAQHADTFLRLPSKLGEAMDTDYVATMVFAHWPGGASFGYDDLRRAYRYAPVFGKFITADEYFLETETPGATSRFKPDEYRTPYLRQAVSAGQADPLSRTMRLHRRRAFREGLSALDTFCTLVSGHARRTSAKEGPDDSPVDDVAANALDADETRQLQEIQSAMAAAIGSAATGETVGRLWLNPLSFSRQAACVSSDVMPAEDKVAKLPADESPAAAVVEVPPAGFAWVDAHLDTPPVARRRRRRRKPLKPMAEGNVLRNDFFELTIDPATGGIRTVHDIRYRGNRFSQQLAFRQAEPAHKPGEVWQANHPGATYSVMAADAIEVVHAGPAVGEIVASGRLVDQQGRRLAGFRQAVRLLRTSRVVQLDIELDPDEIPGDDPWKSYYAARFAWPDTGAELWRSVHGGAYRTEAARIEAPRFIEARNAPFHTAILTGGLPYHRYLESHKLDTLLIVRGETQRRFRLGVAFDVDNVARAARDLLTPTFCLAHRSKPASGDRGWFFHLDVKNVVATHWQPWLEADRVVGVRLRLLETLGKSCRARLRGFRPVDHARQLDFQGESLLDLSCQDDTVTIELTAHEWVEIEVRFAS